MKMQEGFSLLECMIYILITTITCMAMSSFIIQSLHRTTVLEEANAAAIVALCATDCLARDIKSAPCSIEQWIVHKEDHIAWHNNGRVVGFKYTKNRLMRISGQYNALTQKVEHKTSSTLAQQVTQCKYYLHKEKKRVRGVELQLSLKKGKTVYENGFYCALKNS